MSFTKQGVVEEELEWELDEKPPNPMKETEKENRKTNENILAL